MTIPSGIETEFKWRVRSERELEAIAAAAGDGARSTVTQTNHFFDTEQRALGSAGWALRLRAEGPRFLLTAKGPKRAAQTGGGGDEITVRPEVEVELPADVARAALEGRGDPLEPLASQGADVVAELRSLAAGCALVHVGSFRNRRTRLGPVALAAGPEAVEVVLELDRTEFPGDVVHWEVEVEVESTQAAVVGRALEQLLARAGVVGRIAPSKAQRFFRALAGEAIDG